MGLSAVDVEQGIQFRRTGGLGPQLVLMGEGLANLLPCRLPVLVGRPFYHHAREALRYFLGSGGGFLGSSGFRPIGLPLRRRSMGSAAAFMLTGPSTKITNLGALKIVLGVKRFLLYIAFVMVFSFATGLAVNLVV